MKKYLFLGLLFISAIASAASLGTAFTYSGRLIYKNQPANGNFDLQVKLFDAATAGNQVGAPINVNALAIVDGLFVTSLDFGSGVFNGTAYWLEISARPNGNGSFTLLSPRQAVTPSPYALYAPNAGGVTANSISGASIQNSAITANKIAGGEVVKSLNSLHDDVTLAAGANITITPSANTLTIASSAGASLWSLTGNAGTTPGVNFLGTTDNKPLELRVVGGRALRLEAVSRGNIFNSSASLNILGGSGVNSISANVMGATVAGGGSSIFFGSTFLDFPNSVTGDFGTISGGENNIAGPYGTVPGGSANNANGQYSFAAGRNANANHERSFVWSSYPRAASSFSAERFHVFARNGFSVDFDAQRDDGGGAHWAGFGVFPGQTLSTWTGAFLDDSGDWHCRDATVRALTITGGADLAEPFEVSENELPKGSVVVIDAQQPGKLKLSTDPYDTRVAGVISGAGGVHPGIQMRQTGTVEGTENVALTGRVYVMADASHGPINPGDLLTTSATPGHAMKVSDHARAQGAILGKAMSTLADGKGLVLVLVTLQ